MDINSLSGINRASATSSIDRASSVKKTSSADASSATSSAKLSVLNLTAALAGREPDNSKRISELKQAIEQGTYQVNAQSVAEKLMRDELGV